MATSMAPTYTVPVQVRIAGDVAVCALHSDHVLADFDVTITDPDGTVVRRPFCAPCLKEHLHQRRVMADSLTDFNVIR